MSNALQLAKSFCQYLFVERDCERLLSLLTQDICWLGNAHNEDVCSLEQAQSYFLSEIAAMPGNYQMEVAAEKQCALGAQSGTAMLRLHLTCGEISTSAGVLIVTKPEDGTEKICSLQMAVIDAVRQPGEDYITTKSKQKIANAKTELALSTMSGGLMGGYMKPGFSFYFINERMVAYLGYDDQNDFVADIDGMIENCMHPDDRARVNALVAQQIAASGSYAVDYRMKKKDGSYIWVHDIGKKALAENDAPVIISACYDITEERQKQAELDNLMDALPGGAVLYRKENDQMRVLYQSKGVSQLSGHTPEQFQKLVSEDIRNSVYSDDVNKVIAAINKAATSDDTVSIDFRIPHVNGGTVWINASYKCTAVEDGCPIIHAVFSEMPQLRELMSDVIENSGVAVIVSDHETWELLYVNQAALDALGKTERDYEGKVCYEYLLGRDTPCAFCKNLCIDTETEKTAETYLPQLDRYFITQGRLVNWAGRTAHVESLMDITTAKKSKQQLNEMLDNITCGVVVSRRKDDKSEILYINKGFCDLFEQDAETLRASFLNQSAANVYEEDLPGLQQMKLAIRRGVPHSEASFRYRYSGERTKWIRVDVNTVKGTDATYTTYASYYDVTAQMQQEEQLKSVIHNVPGGVCLYRWDGNKLNPIIVSEQYSALLGEDAMALMTRTKGMAFEHTHPDDMAGLHQAILKAFGETGKIEHTFRSLNLATNEYLWIRLTGVAVPQADGTQLAYVSYTDVTKQQLTEQQLRASERAIDFATEEAGLWYWQYDPSKDCAYFGERCMHDFDLPAVLENFPQAWLASGHVLPEHHATYAAAIQKIKDGEPQVCFEAQLQDNFGAIHWAELRLSNPPDGQSLVVCTARIIDYEKTLQTKFELEKQKPTLGEKALLFHATFNLTTGETTDYGYTGEEALSEGDYTTFRQAIENISPSIVGEDAKKEFLAMNRTDYLMDMLRQGKTSVSMDYRRKIPSGRILWVRNLLNLVQVPSTNEILLFEYCYDVHSQRMAHEMLTTTTTYDYECIAGVDFRINKILYYGKQGNDASPEVKEYGTAMLSYADGAVLPEARAQFEADNEPQTVMAQVAKNGTHVFLTKVRNADGTEGIAKTRFVPYDLENQIYILTRTNVTDLLRGEENKNKVLHEALAVAQQANSAKSDFLSSMSHDIRTPMNAIVGMCELALKDESDRAQVHESLETIQSSSGLLLSLINNILDMSRIESGKMVLTDRPFSIREEITKTVETFKALAAQKGQVFQTDVNIQHDCCLGDVTRIHSALDNILSNSIKYTPKCGSITYRILELPSERSEIGLYRFEIADTGVGISEEQQLHLFEPFYRGESSLTSSVEGTGLGLSITKAIIDLKGGTISVKSGEGVGTTFVVELPLTFAQETAQPVRPIAKKGSFDLSNLHILVCEDHPVNQKVITRILEKAGASVTIAEDGAMGVEQFMQHPADTFDLVLMDIQMPKMNGYAAAKAIRESKHPQAAKIPILAMTANAFAEDVQKSISAGMNAHLAKPVVPDQLYASILQHTGNCKKAERGKRKVLFVDDVELNIVVLTQAIHEEYEVLVARSGQEALDILAGNLDIAAVITDIMMPGIDGITLIKSIRANDRYRNMAVLANTQYGDAAQEEALRALGADDFLYKPTTPAQVQSRLKAALRKHHKNL